ncbi:MAG: S41 family peptidase [Halanaerobiaceae bacterium]
MNEFTGVIIILNNKINYKKLVISTIIFTMILISSGKVYTEELSSFTKLRQIMYMIEKYYVEDVDEEEMVESAIEGIVEDLDSYSSYLTSEEYSEMQMEFEGEYGGIGIVITTRDDELTIVSPFRGTPGDEAGLKAGDVIIEIDGEPTDEIAQEKAVDLMRGTPGTDVTIKIRRKETENGENEETREVTLTRAKIEIPYVRSEILEDNIGYVTVVQFADEIGFKVEKEIKDLKEQGAEAIILDLRNNPGGILEEAVDLSSNFVKEGTLVSVKQRNEEKRVLKVNDSIETTDLPLVVLINEGSASGSEIVAAAIKEYNRGKLLGTKTFGKGTVQTVAPIEDGSALRLTTARYYTPSGNFIHEKGIEPDIEVEHDPDYDGDIQLDRAIKYLKPEYEMKTVEKDNNKVSWHKKSLGEWIKEKIVD